MYEALTFACVALFWLSVPLLLLYRARRPDVPWVFVIMSAMALGWILANASVFFQHAAIDEERMEELACFSAPHDESKSVKVVNADGVTETVVENPCGIGDWLRDEYKPLLGLLYGPVYLLCCALPYWLLIVRRTTPRLRRQIVWLAAGAFVIEWAAILGKGSAAIERVNPEFYWSLRDYLDPHVWLPLTIATAFLASWIVTSQVLQRFAPRA